MPGPYLTHSSSEIRHKSGGHWVLNLRFRPHEFRSRGLGVFTVLQTKMESKEQRR